MLEVRVMPKGKVMNPCRSAGTRIPLNEAITNGLGQKVIECECRKYVVLRRSSEKGVGIVPRHNGRSKVSAA